jgi:hypothetical protein
MDVSFVMAGLVPAIHGLHRQDVDARHKAGHDGLFQSGSAVTSS